MLLLQWYINIGGYKYSNLPTQVVRTEELGPSHYFSTKPSAARGTEFTITTWWADSDSLFFRPGRDKWEQCKIQQASPLRLESFPFPWSITPSVSQIKDLPSFFSSVRQLFLIQPLTTYQGKKQQCEAKFNNILSEQNEQKIQGEHSMISTFPKKKPGLIHHIFQSNKRTNYRHGIIHSIYIDIGFIENSACIHTPWSH